MNLKKTSARKRWRDPEFKIEIMPLVSTLTSGPIALNNVDIAGISIGKDGPIEELWNINLYKAKIEDTNMSYADIACSLNESSMRKVTLIGAELDRCLIRNSNLSNCNFSKARLIVSLDDSALEDCIFCGALISGGKSMAEYGGRRVKFTRCDFSDATFRNVEFRASTFINCTFKNTRFVGCDLRGAKAEGQNLPFSTQFEKMEPPIWALTSGDK